MSEEQKEKIEFQFIMSYKAYRRKMIGLRVAVTAVVAGGLLGLCAISVMLGLVLAAAVIFVGVISVLAALGAEQTYTVYNTRIVFKRRGNDSRISVPMDNVLKVSYRRAFYEKDLATGTVTVTAKNEKGKIKKYKMKHVFDAKPAGDYINNAIET